jgi:hypothetical protein
MFVLKKLGSAALLFSLCVLAGACHFGEATPIDLDKRHRRSAALKSFDSCADLLSTLQENALEETNTQVLMQHSRQKAVSMDMPEAAMDEASFAGASGDTGRQEGVDFSGTNNQESSSAS